MRVFESKEMVNIEKAAVRAGGSLATLMEKAGAAVADLATKIVAEKKLKTITVLCGKGNNGGDGFVIARFLSYMFDVNVIIANDEPETDLAKLNYNLVPDKVNIFRFYDNYNESVETIQNSDMIIDAIYGIGFKECLDPSSLEIVQLANFNDHAVRIAVDIPSGIICDTGEIPGGCFSAHYTVTFTAMKPLHVLYPSIDFCGKITVADIGIPDSIVQQFTYAMVTTDEFLARHPLRSRNRSAHKGTNGTLLSVCGSYGMAGAAVMSGMAALRSGVGILKCAVPKSIYPITANALTEAVFMPLEENDQGTLNADEGSTIQFEIMERASAVLIGCGLGTNDDTKRLVSNIISSSTKPIVLDADGINSIVDNIDILRTAMVPVILTPHPGEMARLVGTTALKVQTDRCRTAQNFAMDYGVTVVLKGADTIIALPDGNVYVNLTGNNGMARGGSGDVLAGILASFLAQGMSHDEAAINAVYYHGLAGDRCAKKYSARAMLPRDIIEELKYIFSD